MRIKVNGVWAQLEVRTVADVLMHYGMERKRVVVEANGIIVDSELWETTPVADGTVLEIVHFVGGG